MTYPARILWQPTDYTERWNHMLARCVEVFGLPGDRFITDIGPEAMTWAFRDDRDALIFKLKFSEVAC
jgi:hypothetical protein